MEYANISKREKEILLCLLEGFSDKSHWSETLH